MKKNILIITCFLFILFRIPSLFEPYWHGDEGITLTVGQTIAKGAVLYRDITDNKTPILYFIAALSGTLFNFKLIMLLVSLGALIAFVRLRDMVIQAPEYFSIILFAVLAGTPLLEANIANAEIFMVLPIVLSFVSYLKKQYILAGVFASVSFLLKQPGMFEMGALILYAWMLEKQYRTIVLKLIAGFSMPVAAVSLYFLAIGGFSSLISEGFINNILYTGSWYLITDPKLWMAIKVVGLGAFIWYLARSKRSYQSAELLLYLWLAFSLFGATLSNRPYPHYLIQIIPPFALLCGSIVLKKYHRVPVAILIAAIIFFSIAQFKLYSGTLYYTYRYYTQFQSPTFFDEQVTSTEKISSYILKNTSDGEPIFVWSDNSLIYAQTKRPPATKYISAYHIAGNISREEEVIQTLRSNPPGIIVITRPIDHPFDSLLILVDMRYNLAVAGEQFDIYKLEND
ncbi:MAG: hypothetical protein NUV98_06935 [Candidatus Roizmanbacteria bacterium]|nr:hypothetical protein [Candidatus Roizmanbacteria bacterium]